jgi:hypothetical protein
VGDDPRWQVPNSICHRGRLTLGDRRKQEAPEAKEC